MAIYELHFRVTRFLEHKRKLAVQSVGVVTNLLVEVRDLSVVLSTLLILSQDLNSGVATVFDNQKKIEAEAKKLQTQVAKFSKQTSQWLQLVEEFNTALKVLLFMIDRKGSCVIFRLFSKSIYE